jgi:hypothetical protein
MSRVRIREYLTRAKVGVRAGVTTKTVGDYERTAERERAAGRDRPGLLPKRDVFDHDGIAIGWSTGIIDKWMEARPGAGARTDLPGVRGERGRKLSREDDVQAARWSLEGMPMAEISRRLGCRQASGAAWAVKRGLERYGTLQR